GLRILVVDDNIDAAEMLAMLLDLLGHQTHLAHTGPAALDATADFQPEVIFLDIGLPGLSGYEVARRLRADGVTARARLVALTGFDGEDEAERARAAGFDRHVVKPIDPFTLESLLR
ncbi:MAG TPA: response regulator, partial [Polyangia bacterium]